ncbi:MAG: hypothetical protein ACLQVD_11780 [Capsulimonadaceae bacterium]
MNLAKRTQLVEKLRASGALEDLGNHEAPPPVVALEDFFDGNDDIGSIGCNLDEHPGPQAFFATLRDIRQKPGVQDVLVEILEVEDGEWPFSDRVYVLSSAPLDTVEEWFDPLQPDEVTEGIPWNRPPRGLPEPAPKMTVYSAWWD